jgi:ABC-type phosphate/phosphonate transport system substrate-binding protein
MPASIASMQMYEMPENREATDIWWNCLARALRAEGAADVPASLTLVATPIYDADGCDGVNYCSAVIVRAEDTAASLEDLRGRKVAYNGEDSQSGYNCLLSCLAPLARDGRFVGHAIKSGGHRQSVNLVAAGVADFAAVDSVTLALLRRHAPAEVEGVRVLDWTPPTPGLPYITSLTGGPEQRDRVRAALFAAIDDAATADARQSMLLQGFAVVEAPSYQVLLDNEQTARAAGYDRLA